jgi:dephospho-CoA kinase
VSSRTRVIGITGIIGSGKSLVGSILREKDIPVIDTDDIVHELLAHDEKITDALTKLFGSSILGANGYIDRNRLGSLVFNDPTARQQLEQIVHPVVIAEHKRMVAALPGHPVVAVLAPLLFEAGVAGEFNEIWTVIADEPVLRARLKARSNMSNAEIDARLAAQWKQDDKAARSHRVIDNSGTVDDTRRQVEMLLAALR